MTSSGTNAFNPGIGDLVAYAFGRCGIRRTALLQEQMLDARMAANLVLADWSNRGVNLWKTSLVSTPLVQGVATYSVDPATVVILDAYVSNTAGTTATTVDRLIMPISRSEYAALSTKGQQGAITTYWNDRLLSPNITLYYVPDGTAAQAYLKYYALIQLDDAAFTAGQTADLPYLWLKAYADALAAELAPSWAPDRVAMLDARAAASYQVAADQGVEIAQQYLSPQLMGYFR